MKPSEAEKLIMKAREHWFAEEDAAKAAQDENAEAEAENDNGVETGKREAATNV